MPNAVSKHQQLPDYTRYKIGPDAHVTAFGRTMSFGYEYDTGVVLKTIVDEGPSESIPFEWRTVALLIDQKKMDVDQEHFSDRNKIKRAKEITTTPRFDYPLVVVLRARLVTEFLEAEMLSELADVEDEFEILMRVSRSDNSIRKFLAKFEADNPAFINEVKADITERGKGRLSVSPRQFRRLVKRFEEGALDVSSFLPRYLGRKVRECSFTQAQLKFAYTYIDKIRDPHHRGGVAAAWRMMDGDNLLLPPGEQHAHLPSGSTFRRMFLAAGDLVNEGSRTTNRWRVARKYGVARKGLQPQKPLEIIEMDEQQLDLVNSLTENGVWEYLHPAVQKELMKDKWKRPWLSIAMDAYSRSICGMKMSLSGSRGQTAIATLAMVAEQKTRLALLVGATTDWPQCGTPERVHTDAGAGYNSGEFQMAVMMYTGNSVIPPSKHPHLRGRVERFFLTFNQRYVHLFVGQTFSNPLLRDEYDTEKFGNLTDEMLADLLVRLIIDCYHNTVHGGIGMTPLDKWYYGSQRAKGSVAPPPTVEQRRAIFGSSIEVTIGTDGIKIAGITYSSPKTTEISKKLHGAKLTANVNEYDISKISIKHMTKNEWIPVPATMDGLENRTIYDWKQTIRAHEAKFGKSTSHDKRTVAATMAEVVRASNQSSQRLLENELTPSQFIMALDADIGDTFGYTKSEIYDDGHDHRVLPMPTPIGDSPPPSKMTIEVGVPGEVQKLGTARDVEPDPVRPRGSSKFNPGGDAIYTPIPPTSQQDRRVKPASTTDRVNLPRAEKAPSVQPTEPASATYPMPNEIEPSAAPKRRALGISTKSNKGDDQ